MKKILLLILSLVIVSCKSESALKVNEKKSDTIQTIINEHNAMNSLDYDGSYIGNLPCADCESIETTIVLSLDTYNKETIYKGKSNKTFKESGKYSWNKAGNTITLLGSEVPNQYFVGENVLFHLNTEGKRIKGNLAKNYELVKVEKINNNNEVSLSNSKWRLVKLNGKNIEENKNSTINLGIIFTPDGMFSAFAGCNSMAGSYELNEKTSQITFSKMIMTMMACPDMHVEQELGKVLEMADNYNFDGKTLKLNKARMAYLAEFELIK